MLNIKTLIASALLSSVAAASFAQAPTAPVVKPATPAVMKAEAKADQANAKAGAAEAKVDAKADAKIECPYCKKVRVKKTSGSFKTSKIAEE